MLSGETLPLVDVEAAAFRARPIESKISRRGRANAARKGRRGAKVARGRCIGYARDTASGAVHPTGSMVAKLERDGSLDGGIDGESLRYRKIAGRSTRNILFIIDASGSMLSAERLALVKGCAISLLKDAYVKRTRVAVVSYGGAQARLVLPFTSSPELAARGIETMKGGGGTPLVEALGIASRVIERLDGEPAQVVMLSDGRYNRVRAAERLIRSFGAYCRRNDVPIHFVDAGAGTKTSRRRAALLAGKLQAELCSLDDLRLE